MKKNIYPLSILVCISLFLTGCSLHQESVQNSIEITKTTESNPQEINLFHFINVSDNFRKEITQAIIAKRIEYFHGNVSDIENWRKEYQIVDVDIIALEDTFSTGVYGDRNIVHNESDGGMWIAVKINDSWKVIDFYKGRDIDCSDLIHTYGFSGDLLMKWGFICNK